MTKDSGIKQAVLRQIIEAMGDDSAKSIRARLKGKTEEKEKKVIKMDGLSDIRRMLS